MKRILYFLLVITILVGDELIVKSEKDSKRLLSIGISCKKNKDYYLCLENDLNYLKRVKDFLKKEYNISSYIVKDFNKKDFKTTQNLTKKVYLTHNKGNYCIQIVSTKSFSSAKKLFEKYKTFPLVRVEKIGKYYTLRIAEGNYKDVKQLYKNIKRGYIRKCNLVSDRIVLKNFNKVNLESINKKVLKKVANEDETINIKTMYYYLNNGELNKAENLAKKFYQRGYIKDALYVLGLVSLKKQNFYKSCNYFTRLEKLKHTLKVRLLKNNSCSIYYLKLGFNYLNTNPNKAKKFFNKSLQFKYSLDAKIGLVYAYLNVNEKKALKLAQKLYSKYPNNKKVILLLAQVYNSLGEYKKVEELSKKYPELNKTDIMFYSKLKEAQDLLRKNPKKAEKILLYLYRKNPSNINLLLSLGNLYFNMNKLNKAIYFYKNVLLLSPSNFYALKGLEGIYIKKDNYKKALEYSDNIVSLGYKDEDRKKIINNLYLKEAKKYIKENNFNKAKEVLAKIDDNPDKYILLGDIYYKLGDNVKAYKNYSKAYSLNPENFDVKLKFLYSLLKLNLFEQIKIVLDNLDKDKLTSSQKLKLKQFYNALFLKYASYLLNNKEYNKSLVITNKGLEYDFNNYKLYSVKGWSCYNLNKLKCAEESFRKFLKYEPDNADAKYGLSLVLYKENKIDEAKRLLDSIKTDDEELKINIAELYALIGDIKKSKKMLNSIKTNKENKIYKKDLKKDEFPDVFDINLHSNKKKIIFKEDKYHQKVNKIKKLIKLKSSKRISNISVGLFIRNKSGEKGTSKLRYLNPFFEWNLYNDSVKFYGQLNYNTLNSGKIKNYNKVGSANNSEINTSKVVTNFNTFDRGFSGTIGISIEKNNKLFDIGIGVTPFKVKSDISPAITAYLKFQIKNSNKKYRLSLYRNSIKDSILSFVGNKDPYTSKKWGRVLSNGVMYEYENILDKNDSIFYLSLSYEYIRGKNTNNNQKIDLTMFPLWYVGDYLLDKDYLGVYFDIYHYEKDENYFYYKNGGYYSPSLFLLIGPRYEGYYGNNKNYLFKIMVNPALSFKDDASTSFYFDGGGSAIYVINKHIAIESGLDMRFSKDYNDYLMFFNIRYYFGEKYYIFKKDVDKILKRISKW